MMLTPVAQQVLVADAEQRLAEMHQELTAAMAALAEETRRPEAELQKLSALRLKLSKAGRQRAALLDAILGQRVQSAPPADLPALLELRRTVQQARATSTAHVSRWTPQAVVEDWTGYCRASLALRKAMAAQIEREAALLCVAPAKRQL
ncbi:MAG TPA: hypothetical protein VF637_04710 [Sphingomicrobium sp.]|jgi:hypothetical protein